MTDIELLTIVQRVTGFSLTHLRHRQREVEILDARYVLILLLLGEGYEPRHIADLLMMPISTVQYSRRTADKLLQTDKRLKALYLTCITHLTEIEDAN